LSAVRLQLQQTIENDVALSRFAKHVLCGQLAVLGVTQKRMNASVRVNLNCVNLNYVNPNYVNQCFLIGMLQFEKQQFGMRSFEMTAPAVAASQCVLWLMNELLDSGSAFEGSWSIPDR